MKVIAKRLAKALSALPEPVRANQHLKVEILDKLFLEDVARKEAKTRAIQLVTLTSIEYRDKFGSWFEWEIEL